MTMTKTIRVALADDHRLVRQGLRGILEDAPDIEVGVEAADGRELLALIRQKPCHVVLLDITMPGKNGIEVLREIKRERPALPVLMLTMHGEDLFGTRALAAGADGYLTKDSSPDQLLEAVRTVAAGERYVSEDLAAQLGEDVDDLSRPPSHKSLSNREFQVLRLLASAKTVTETAEDLDLSVKTVSTYRARILQKLHLRNTAELIQYAIRKKLVD